MDEDDDPEELPPDTRDDLGSPERPPRSKWAVVAELAALVQLFAGLSGNPAAALVAGLLAWLIRCLAERRRR